MAKDIREEMNTNRKDQREVHKNVSENTFLRRAVNTQRSKLPRCFRGERRMRLKAMEKDEIESNGEGYRDSRSSPLLSVSLSVDEDSYL